MRTVLKAVALFVAVLAVTLRAALPDGWMPAAQVSAPLMLCPGMTDMSAMPGMAHPKPAQKPSHDQDHSGGMICPFAAAAGHVAAPADPAPAALPVSVSTFDTFAVTRAATLQGASWQPNAARAPPSLA